MYRKRSYEDANKIFQRTKGCNVFKPLFDAAPNAVSLKSEQHLSSEAFDASYERVYNYQPCRLSDSSGSFNIGVALVRAEMATGKTLDMIGAEFGVKRTGAVTDHRFRSHVLSKIYDVANGKKAGYTMEVKQEPARDGFADAVEYGMSKYAKPAPKWSGVMDPTPKDHADYKTKYEDACSLLEAQVNLVARLRSDLENVKNELFTPSQRRSATANAPDPKPKNTFYFGDE